MSINIIRNILLVLLVFKMEYGYSACELHKDGIQLVVNADLPNEVRRDLISNNLNLKEELDISNKIGCKILDDEKITGKQRVRVISRNAKLLIKSTDAVIEEMILLLDGVGINNKLHLIRVYVEENDHNILYLSAKISELNSDPYLAFRYNHPAALFDIHKLIIVIGIATENGYELRDCFKIEYKFRPAANN